MEYQVCSQNGKELSKAEVAKVLDLTEYIEKIGGPQNDSIWVYSEGRITFVCIDKGIIGIWPDFSRRDIIDDSKTLMNKLESQDLKLIKHPEFSEWP